MQVAYILGTFPKLSETFILREIQELERQGTTVRLLALNRPEDAVDEELSPLVERTLYPTRAIGIEALSGLRPWPLRRFWRYRKQECRLFRDLFPNLPLATRRLRLLAIGRYFASRLRGEGVNRVHAHFAGAPALAGLVAAEILGVPFSFSAHANDVFVGPELVAWKAREADLIFTCNRAALEKLLALVGEEDRAKVHLIHHGIEVAEYGRASGPAASGPPLLLSVGRLEEKKGYDDLLAAAGVLRSAGVEFRLEIVGEGSQRRALEELCARLELTSVVQFAGACSHSQVKERLAGAAVFVLASKPTRQGDQDGIPNVLLEAAASGAPIAATTAGSIPEFITHESNGLLSEPGRPSELADNVRKLLVDGNLADALQAQARRDVEADFELCRNVAGIRALIESVSAPE